ncbi:MAG: glycosyltransferase family 4 protein [Rhodospirillaceae bacterium]|nr:glycosyltransferase family 4 protein [Rhodospirillaceae bacterium]
MKIVHITADAAFGSTVAQFERLTAALHDAGVGQRVIAPASSDAAQRLKARGIEIIEMNLPGAFAFLDRRKINAELKRYTPDIVMTWMPEASVLVEGGGYVHVGRAPLAFDIERLKTCNALIAPSQARAETAIDGGWATSAIHVLPHLPSTSLYTGQVTPVDRKKLFTPATSRLIFTAARLEQGKGIADLLAALARLSSVYLWIAGDGADRAALEERAYELGVKPRVRFLGWQDDLRPYLAAADAFIYPARQEDLGDAIVEAWAQSVPVIAADSLGPGLLVQHQENGLLVPVNDPQSLAEAIKFILVEPETAKKLGAAGRAAYERAFQPANLVKAYIDLFQTLTSRTPMSTAH